LGENPLTYVIISVRFYLAVKRRKVKKLIIGAPLSHYMHHALMSNKLFAFKHEEGKI
jgi:hypothetical protein